MHRVISANTLQIISLSFTTPALDAPVDASIGAHSIINGLEKCVKDYVTDSLEGKPKQIYSHGDFTIEPKGAPYVEQLLWITSFVGSDSSLKELPYRNGRKTGVVVGKVISSGMLYISPLAQLCGAVARLQYVTESARLAGVGLSGASLSQYNKLKAKINDIKNAHQYTMSSIEDAISFDGVSLSGVERSNAAVAIAGLSGSTVSTGALNGTSSYSDALMRAWVRRDPAVSTATDAQINDLAATHGVSSWMSPGTPTWEINFAQTAYIITNPLTKAMYELPGSTLISLFPMYLASFTSGYQDEDDLAALMRQFAVSIKKMGFSVNRSQDVNISIEDHVRELVGKAYGREVLESELDGWEKHRHWKSGSIVLSAEVVSSPVWSDSQLRERAPYFGRPVYEWPSAIAPTSIVEVPGGWNYNSSVIITVESEVVTSSGAYSMLTRSTRNTTEIDIEAHVSTIMTVILDLASKAANPAILREPQILVSSLHGLYAEYAHEAITAPNGIMIGGKNG
jgi:hypothetical protein